MSDCRSCWVVAAVMLAAGCSGLSPPSAATGPLTQPAVTPQQAAAWKEIAGALGKQGVAQDGVYTVTFPRDDLFVSIEGMDVPTAAGIASVFRFYQCSCGKTSVLGQFVLADYEVNDVVFALQKEDFVVSSVGPFLLYEKPRLLAVRFQAEGDPRRLADVLRQALNRTGRARTAPQKLD